MKHQVEQSQDVENVGLIDSAFRGSLATAIFLGVLLIPTVSSTELVVLTLVAVYAGLTAFIGWDPFYAMMKRLRKAEPQAPSPTVIVKQHRVQRPVAEGVHKKAA